MAIVKEQTTLLRISWMSLLFTGAGILIFGIIVTASPLVLSHLLDISFGGCTAARE